VTAKKGRKKGLGNPEGVTKLRAAGQNMFDGAKEGGPATSNRKKEASEGRKPRKRP